MSTNQQTITSVEIKRWRPGWREFVKDWYKELVISGNMETTQKFLIDKGYKNRKKYTYGYSTLLFIDITLRGISQVFLCNNPLTGIFILAGVAVTSWELMLYALLSTVISTISAATIGRPPPEDILAGLCGYDGALVGCACWAFMKPSYALQAAFLLPILAGFLHVAFVNFLRTWELPCFTFAFNVVIIMFLYASNSGVIELGLASGLPVEHRESWNEMTSLYAVDATIRGVGQFMFADTTVGSALVIAGICVSSRKGAVIVMIGSLVGWLMARFVFHATFEDNIRSGLYGYNCAGACCALSGGIFYKTSDGAVMIGVIGAVFASLLHFGFAGMFDGLPVLTFPFIVSTWVIMLSRTKWLTEEKEYVRPMMRRMSSRHLDQVGKITNLKVFGSIRGSFKDRFNFDPSPQKRHSLKAVVIQKMESDRALKEKTAAAFLSRTPSGRSSSGIAPKMGSGKMLSFGRGQSDKKIHLGGGGRMLSGRMNSAIYKIDENSSTSNHNSNKSLTVEEM